jgi:hypothetical protein
MEQRNITVKYTGAPPPPPPPWQEWWNAITGAWSKMSLAQKVLLIAGGAGGAIGVYGLAREKKKVE